MADKIFVSYAHPDAEYAIKLADELRNVGLDVWIDQDSLLPGQLWKEEIQKAIQDSNYVIALLSNNSINRRGYVQAELNYALEVFEQIPRGNIFLIPVILDNCQIEDIRLREIHMVNFFLLGWKVGIDKIIKACRKESPTPNKVFPKVQFRSKQTEEKTRLKKAGEIFTNSIKMTFVYISPGTFMMGSPGNEPERENNETLHEVTLTQGFYMQTTQVTVGQWMLFVEDTRYMEKKIRKGLEGEGERLVKVEDIGFFKKIMGRGKYVVNYKYRYWGNPEFEQTDDHPVTRVSWNDAKEFIKWLNNREGKSYRLPTEAEWEYSCRAGSANRYCFGDDESLLTEYAWYVENSNSSTHLVAAKKPNSFGLYDMHGNVWEWCKDLYGDYPSGKVTDPTGPSHGLFRVFRGGCWYNSARHCRLAYRNKGRPDNRDGNVGFRVLLLRS